MLLSMILYMLIAQISWFSSAAMFPITQQVSLTIFWSWPSNRGYSFDKISYSIILLISRVWDSLLIFPTNSKAWLTYSKFFFPFDCIEIKSTFFWSSILVINHTTTSVWNFSTKNLIELKWYLDKLLKILKILVSHCGCLTFCMNSVWSLKHSFYTLGLYS